MCLKIFNNQVQVAEQDITCYKFLLSQRHSDIEDQRFISPYQTFEYELGKEYSSNLQVHTFDYDLAFDYADVNAIERVVEEGFHTIPSEEVARKIVKYKNTLHSYKRDNRKPYVVVKCIIPKGASYYTGMWQYNQSYASNKLKVVEVLKDNKEK